MKKLLIILHCVIFCCLSISSQETKIFYILKIQTLENNCYKITAKSNGEVYTIYSHYENGKNNGKMIRHHDNVKMKIYPFFNSKQVSLSEFKKDFGMEVNPEDSACLVSATMPLNYQEITTDYYGNTIKIKKKMQYTTTDLNGLYRILRCP